MTRKIHYKEAITLLESGQPVNLKVWKLSTGDIIEYHNVVHAGSHWRGGTHRVRVLSSGQIREFRDVTMFEINGYEIYR